jgi:hypothetical protein
VQLQRNKNVRLHQEASVFWWPGSVSLRSGPSDPSAQAYLSLFRGIAVPHRAEVTYNERRSPNRWARSGPQLAAVGGAGRVPLTRSAGWVKLTSRSVERVLF